MRQISVAKLSTAKLSTVELIFRYVIAWITLGSPGYLPSYNFLPPMITSAIAPADAHASEQASAQIPSLPIVNGAVSGAIPGTFSVSDAGQPGYSIPIALPPGVRDVMPELTLAYDGDRRGTFVGAGWALQGFSSITRCNTVGGIHLSNRAIALDWSDKICVDGEPLTTISGTHLNQNSELRLINESFTRVITGGGQMGSGPASFKSYRKDGLQLEFGGTESSRIIPNGQSSVLVWQLSQIVDIRGNSVDYEYLTDSASGESVPARISYAKSSSGVANNRVEFSYRTKTMPTQEAVAGRWIRTNKLLEKISIFTDSELTSEYHLIYNYDPLTFEDRLAEIEHCADGVCLPPTKFTWGPVGSEQPGASGYPARFDGRFSPLPSISARDSAGVSVYERPVIIGDWNGDGTSDIGRYVVEGGMRYIRMFISRGDSGWLWWATLSGVGSLFETGNCNPCAEYPLVTGDFNADGLTDILHVGQDMYFSRGNGIFDRHTGTGLSNFTASNERVGRVYPLDFSGDGRADLVRVTPSGVVAYQNWGGTQFVRSMVQEFPVGAQASIHNAHYYPAIPGDVTGDGLADLFFPIMNGSDLEVHLLVSNAVSLERRQAIKWPISPVSGGAWAHWAPKIGGDFNGDGVGDLFVGDWISSSGQYGNGTSSQASGGIDPVPPIDGMFHLGYINARLVVSGDFNGDGRTDLGAVSDSTGRFITKVGSPNGTLVPNSTDLILTDAQGFPFNPGHNFEETYPIFTGDWNGDGLTDIGRVGPTQALFYTRKRDRTHQLEGITDGFGASIKISYASLADDDSAIYIKGSGAVYPEVDIQPATYVVSAVERSNSLSSASRTKYSYKGLRANVQTRSAMGFEQVTTVDELTGNSSTKWFGREDRNRGSLFKTELRTAAGAVVKRTELLYTNYAQSSGRNSRYITEQIESTFETDGTPISSVTTKIGYDFPNGNEIQRTVQYADGHSQVTDQVYLNSASNPNLRDLLNRSTVTTKSSPTATPIVKVASFVYNPSSNLLEKENIEADDAALRVATLYTHDSYGNIDSTTVRAPDGQTRTTYQTFDPSGRFIVERRNALGHRTTTTYDARFGKPTGGTDPNGISLGEIRYDGFGRVTYTRAADGTEERTLYLKPDARAPADAAAMIRIDRSAKAPVFVYHDAQAREVRTRTTSLNGKVVISDKVYDEQGRLTHQSEPYFEGTTPLWIVNEYDVVGRLVRVNAPGARSIEYRYKGLKKEKVHPSGEISSEQRDLRGNVVRITDQLGNTLQNTYRADGLLERVTDPAGNVTVLEYNRYGQRTKIIDPSAGTSTINYNGFGEVLWQTNGNGERTDFKYDTIGRLIERRTRDGVDRFTFDTAANGIGKPASRSSAFNIVERFRYDSLGRPASTETVIGSNVYTSSVGYDALGRLSSLTYPTGFKTENRYNSLGYLTEIRDASSGTRFWKAVTSDNRGELTQVQLGNGLVTTKAYDQNTGLLQRITTGGSSRARVDLMSDLTQPIAPALFSTASTSAASPATSRFSTGLALVERGAITRSSTLVQDLSFAFDKENNLLSRSDALSKQSEQFEYDKLNRLTSSQVNGELPITVSYNAIGNILSKSDVGTYLYGGSTGGPHAVTEIRGARANNYRYDGAGQRVESDDGFIRYSVSGKPIAIFSPGHEIQFSLDASDQRIVSRVYSNWALVEQKTALNIGYELLERGATKEHRHYVNGPDGPVALVTSTSANPATDNKVLYLHTDHLGSVESITDATGAVVERLSFDPWGARRDPKAWGSVVFAAGKNTDRGFTGHEHLDEAQLIHMNGRVYDPLIARFVSPDPHLSGTSSLQALNRYSYVSNNPLSYTDPSGYFLKGLKKFLRRAAQIAIPILISLAVGGPILGPVGTATFGNVLLAAAVSSVASSTASGLLAGASFGQSLTGALRGIPRALATAALTNFVGDIPGLLNSADMSCSSFWGPLTDYAAELKMFGHAAVQGTSSVLSGGRFMQGAAAGLVGARSDLLGPVGSILGGGIASAISGGSFADGALAATTVYLFNECAHGECTRGLNKAMQPSDSTMAGAAGQQRASNPNQHLLWPEWATTTYRHVGTGPTVGANANIRTTRFDWHGFYRDMRPGLATEGAAVAFSKMAQRQVTHKVGIFGLVVGTGWAVYSNTHYEAPSWPQGWGGAPGYRPEEKR